MEIFYLIIYRNPIHTPHYLRLLSLNEVHLAVTTEEMRINGYEEIYRYVLESKVLEDDPDHLRRVDKVISEMIGEAERTGELNLSWLESLLTN